MQGSKYAALQHGDLFVDALYLAFHVLRVLLDVFSAVLRPSDSPLLILDNTVGIILSFIRPLDPLLIFIDLAVQFLYLCPGAVHPRRQPAQEPWTLIEGVEW